MVRVDLYDGSLGPTIRFGVSRRDELAQFCRILARLARGQLHSFLIAQDATFSITGLDTLVLHLDEVARGPNVAQLDGPLRAFEWRSDKDGWRHCLSLAHALLKAGPGYHQYLSQDGHDAAVIELAYAES